MGPNYRNDSAQYELIHSLTYQSVTYLSKCTGCFAVTLLDISRTMFCFPDLQTFFPIWKIASVSGFLSIGERIFEIHKMKLKDILCNLIYME